MGTTSDKSTVTGKTRKAAGDKARDLGRVQEAEANRTSAAAWRSKQSGFEIEVPSGNVAIVRRPGPEMFLKSGKIPDALTPIVMESIRDKQGLPPEKAADLMGDPTMLPQLMEMVDAAVVAACVQPAVRPDPPCIRPSEEDSERLCDRPSGDPVHVDPKFKGQHEFIPGDALPEGERDPDFLYAGEVDFNDKMFIFQYALGGSADLERFREEYAESVAGVDAVASGRE